MIRPSGCALARRPCDCASSILYKMTRSGHRQWSPICRLEPKRTVGTDPRRQPPRCRTTPSYHKLAPAKRRCGRSPLSGRLSDRTRLSPAVPRAAPLRRRQERRLSTGRAANSAISFVPLKDCPRLPGRNDWNKLELHQVAPVDHPLL